MEGMSTTALIKTGVVFDIHGFIITPFLSFLFIVVLCSLFFVLCVNRAIFLLT